MEPTEGRGGGRVRGAARTGTARPGRKRGEIRRGSSSASDRPPGLAIAGRPLYCRARIFPNGTSALTALRLFRHSSGLPPDARGAAVAIGNFDGVHLGHQAVIGRAVERAEALAIPSAALTFEPHPRMLFKPESEPFRLTPLRPKAHAIEALGVEILIVLAFDRALSLKSAEAFVEDVLVTGMAVGHVVVGEDFVFGHDRLGNVESLARMGDRLGFTVTALKPVAGPEGTVYSSTAVRQALQAGEPRLAACAGVA